MAVTEISLAQRTFAALVNVGADPAKLKLPNLIALVPDALELIAKRVADSDQYEGLQIDFAVTPAAGLLDLGPQTNVLFEISKSRLRVAATGKALTPVDSYATLEDDDLPTDQVWYAQDGNMLRFRSTTPSLTDYATALQLKANYIPSLTDPTYPMFFQYEGALVRTILELTNLGQVAKQAMELVDVGKG